MPTTTVVEGGAPTMPPPTEPLPPPTTAVVCPPGYPTAIGGYADGTSVSVTILNPVPYPVQANSVEVVGGQHGAAQPFRPPVLIEANGSYQFEMPVSMIVGATQARVPGWSWVLPFMVSCPTPWSPAL
jgi:hypothetical protein